MSKFETNRKAKEEQKTYKRHTREIMAKYFLDLSKVLITAVAVTAFSPWFTDYDANINIIAASFGLVGAMLLAILGYKILNTK